MDEKEPKAQPAEENIAVPAKVEAAGHFCPICGSDAATAGAPKKGGTWSLLKMGACCGGALLLLVLILLVAATGGTFAAVGSSILSIAALLACPLGMYFMMRGMQRMDHRGKAQAAGRPGTGGRVREPGDDAAGGDP